MGRLYTYKDTHLYQILKLNIVNFPHITKWQLPAASLSASPASSRAQNEVKK